MPITSMSVVTPLSRYWTHEEVVSEAMVLTGVTDNEVIQLDNVRNHMNVSISYIAKLLNLAASPHYGIWLKGELENELHPTGLEWINLATPLDEVVPSQLITNIKRVNVPRIIDQADSHALGNCVKYDLAELTQLDSYQNVQYRFTIAWAHHGSELLVFTGSSISTTNKPGDSPDYVLTDDTLVMIAQRKPVLDNLVAPSNAAQTAQDGNYRANVDLPDEYIELLIKMMQKKILEQRREAIPAQLEQEVNLGLQAITASITNEVNFEKMEREKVRYGNAQTTQSGGYFPNNQG